MNPDELLKMDHEKEIIMIRGKEPFMCKKFDYSSHPEAEKLKDITQEELSKGSGDFTTWPLLEETFMNVGPKGFSVKKK